MLTRFVRADRHFQHSNTLSQAYPPHQTPDDAPAAGASTKQPKPAPPTAPIMVQSASDVPHQQQEPTAGPSSAPAPPPAARNRIRLDTQHAHAHAQQQPTRKVTKATGGTRNTNISGPMTAAQRPAYIARYAYADMRDASFHSPGPLLPKIPSPHEAAVIFHAPDAPGVDYGLFRKATHDFLDFDATFALYPTYCLLPATMKPTREDWDDTRDVDQEEGRKVRCLFCRSRFGGRNAKAMWERHAREHWDKGGE